MISGEKIIGVVGFDFKGSEEIMATEKRVVLKTIAGWCHDNREDGAEIGILPHKGPYIPPMNKTTQD